MNDMPTSDRLLPRHPVRVVANRSGLSPHVLRAWERRYGVVVPTRSEGGQRLYSDEDLERLTLLHGLTADGAAISQVARLPLAELRRLALARPAHEAATDGEDLAAARTAALEAAQALDAARLRRMLERGAVVLGVPTLLEEVVGPLLVQIGELWHAGRMTIAQEHFATAVVRRMLGWIFEMAQPDTSAPVLLSATPEGQIHEGGALLAAATAAGAGWRVIYLGAALPAAEIARAAAGTAARVVALSLVYPAALPETAREIRALRAALPAGTILLVGGSAAPGYAEEIAEAGGQVIADLPGLRAALHTLRNGARP